MALCLWKNCTAVAEPFSVFCAQHWAERKWKFEAQFQAEQLNEVWNEVSKWIAKTSWNYNPLSFHKAESLSTQEAERLSIARFCARKMAKRGDQKAKLFLTRTEKLAQESVAFEDFRGLSLPRVQELFPTARPLDNLKQPVLRTALERAEAIVGDFLTMLDGEALAPGVATAWLHGAFGNAAESVAQVRKVLGLMRKVLLYWAENVANQRNIAESLLYGRFNWQAATNTNTALEGQLNLELPLQPRDPNLSLSEPHVCFPPDVLDTAVGGTDADRLNLCHTLLHECVHGISKEYSTDHAYRSNNPARFKTLGVPLRLKNPDHYKVMLAEWSPVRNEKPMEFQGMFGDREHKELVAATSLEAKLHKIFGDPAEWGALPTGVVARIGPLNRLRSEVSQMVQNAMIQSQNEFIELAKSGKANTVEVAKVKTLSDELQRLYSKCTKVILEVDATRKYDVAKGADNVRIIWKPHANPQAGQKAEGWYAFFPSDHANFDKKAVRGWLLKSLLKSTVVRVGSGVTFDAIKQKEIAYYKVGRPGTATEIF